MLLVKEIFPQIKIILLINEIFGMMKQLQSINLSIHGIKVKCSSNNSEFISYVNDHMSYFLTESNGNHNIETKIWFKKNINSNATMPSKKLGVNVYQDEEKLLYFEENLDVEASFSKNKMIINCQIDNSFKFKASIKKIIKFLLGRRVEKSHDFFILIRRLIIFPLFHYMENYRDTFLMHASAFKLDNKTVVMAGLANVGKSTSSLSATLDLKGKFISDNYLLFNKSKVFCFPELVRVSDEILDLIDNKNKLGKHLYVRGHRKLYALSPDKIVDSDKINSLVIPSLGKNCDYENITLEYAIDLIMSSNEYVNEFHNTDFISIINRVYPRSYSVLSNKIHALRDLLKDVPIYLVTLSLDKSPKENIEYIMNIIHEKS